MGINRQTCKACGRPDYFDFHMPERVWKSVVPPGLVGSVVCLSCFDEFAREAGVSYADHIHTLYFAGDQAIIVFRAQTALDA